MFKIVKSLSMIAIALAVVVGGTYAYFTSTKTSTADTINTGTLNIAVNGDTSLGEGTFDIDLGGMKNLAPGEKSGPVTIQVHNSGSLNAATFGKFVLGGADTSLASKLIFYDYEVKYYNANGTSTGRVDTFIQNGEIRNAAFTPDSIVLLNWVNGYGPADIPEVSWDMEGMKPGEFYRLTFRFIMDPLADNEFQNKALDFGYQVKATQVVKEAVQALEIGGNMDTAIDAHMTYLKNAVGI